MLSEDKLARLKKLQAILGNDVYYRLLHNVVTIGHFSFYHVLRLATPTSMLRSAFRWEESEEGREYWEDIEDRLKGIKLDDKGEL